MFSDDSNFTNPNLAPNSSSNVKFIEIITPYQVINNWRKMVIVLGFSPSFASRRGAHVYPSLYSVQTVNQSER